MRCWSEFSMVLGLWVVVLLAYTSYDTLAQPKNPALIIPAAPPVAISPQITVPCRVVEVYDGDTPTVEVTIRSRVRLLDCWAPEMKGSEKAKGKISRDKLAEWTLGKTGYITIPLYVRLGDSFTFDRVLGRLYVDGQDVSEKMVAGGYATKTKEK